MQKVLAQVKNFSFVFLSAECCSGLARCVHTQAKYSKTGEMGKIPVLLRYLIWHIHTTF